MKHKRSIISIVLAALVLVSLCAVVATASVSAAPASSSASPNLVGSPIAAGTTPAVCKVVGTNTVYVFVQGSDGALWYRTWNALTFLWATAWQPLGGQIMPGTSPAAVSRSAGVVDVYVTGKYGVIYQMPGSTNGFYTWHNFGGSVLPGTGPSASGWTNREDIWVVGTNGALYQRIWKQASGWSSSWGRLTDNGALTSSPAAVSRNQGVVDVFAVGSNGEIRWDWWNSLTSTHWSGLMSLGGKVAPGTGPAVCSYGGYRLDLFYKDSTTGSLYWRTWEWQTPVWTGASSIAAPTAAVGSSPSAATYFFNGHIDIMLWIRGAANGNIYYREYYYILNGFQWVGWHGPYDGPTPT